MAKSSRHFVKQQEPAKYLSDKEKKILIGIGAALIIIVAAVFIITALTDDSIAVKNGELVNTEENWIIANAGDSTNPEYYKYGEYDFTGYEGEIVPEALSYDANSTAVRILPAGNGNAEGYVYAVSRPAKDIAESVSGQMGYMITDGEANSAEEFNGGYIYWYTTVEEAEQEDGSVTETYVQVFSGYMPAAYDGTIVARVTYRFATADEYVDAETGYAAVSELLEYIEY